MRRTAKGLCQLHTLEVVMTVVVSIAHFTMPQKIVTILFFFQAEDGIRDLIVTGVQTCALPISRVLLQAFQPRLDGGFERGDACFEGAEILSDGNGCLLPPLSQSFLKSNTLTPCDRLQISFKIGRASCRERV